MSLSSSKNSLPPASQETEVSRIIEGQADNSRALAVTEMPTAYGQKLPLAVILNYHRSYPIADMVLLMAVFLSMKAAFGGAADLLSSNLDYHLGA